MIDLANCPNGQLTLGNFVILKKSDSDIILQKYKGQTVDYLKIEEYVIENTMLNGNHLIENVLKPLISSEKITKLGLVKRSSNFKKDQYQIGGLL